MFQLGQMDALVANQVAVFAVTPAEQDVRLDAPMPAVVVVILHVPLHARVAAVIVLTCVDQTVQGVAVQHVILARMAVALVQPALAFALAAALADATEVAIAAVIVIPAVTVLVQVLVTLHVQERVQILALGSVLLAMAVLVVVAVILLVHQVAIRRVTLVALVRRRD